VIPVTAGSGERLFEGVGTALELLDTTTFKSGIVVGRHTPT
jgi:hypothetical protein